ncbi:MAG: TetR/AcrR family transcriptional regulator [Ruminococcaceae bacterium]|nr:TetR/AcrR family transcriptional regulator [Oscillospiraceae bacterium]
MSRGSESNRLAKECIVTALVELMKVRDYDSISITDIAKKAGVSRMAYYRNYLSKDDILNKYIEEVGESIHQMITESNSGSVPYDYFYALFDQLGRYSDLAIVAYRAHLGELILSNIIKNMFYTFPPATESTDERYRRHFLAGAFYNVFIEWLKGGLREDAATMARICADMAINGSPTPFLEVNAHEGTR